MARRPLSHLQMMRKRDHSPLLLLSLLQMASSRAQLIYRVLRFLAGLRPNLSLDLSLPGRPLALPPLPLQPPKRLSWRVVALPFPLLLPGSPSPKAWQRSLFLLLQPSSPPPTPWQPLQPLLFPLLRPSSHPPTLRQPAPMPLLAFGCRGGTNPSQKNRT